MKIIVGLGNPGKKYQHTRHNIGFDVIDELQQKLATNDFSNWQKNKKFQAEICQGNFNNEKIIFAKPYTFMNESGASVQALMHFYKIAPLDLIVVHDDIDLPVGKFKIQQDISSAGHKGIKSIIEKINTQKFYRIRIGIAKSNKQKQGDTAKYVLNKFSLLDKIKINKIKQQAAKKIIQLIKS